MSPFTIPSSTLSPHNLPNPHTNFKAARSSKHFHYRGTYETQAAAEAPRAREQGKGGGK